MWLALLALGANALALDCDTPARTHELANALTEAEFAYLDMDEDRFIVIITGAELTLECLGEPITPFDAAAYHRLVALDSFLAGDDAATVMAFRSSLAAQPRFMLPSSIAPPGNPLSDIYDQASEPYEANRIALPPPIGMIILMDGARASARPTARPVIVQLIAADGGVAWSGHLGPNDSNPDWFALGFDVDDSATDLPVVRGDEAPRSSDRDSNIRVARQLPQMTPGRTKPLLLAAGGAALAAGALYGLGYGLRTVYADPSTDYNNLEGLRTATNGSVVASGGVAIAAVGLTLAAAITVEW
jgi:hypothetical protein